MKKLHQKLSYFIVVAGLASSTFSFAYDQLPWPDGRKVNVIHGYSQVDLTPLKSGVRGQVIDRRFNTNQAMYLANEMYLSGTEYYLRASERGLQIANNPSLSFIANVEAYWYSRYNLGSLTIRSRNGIGVIHGPYVDMAAKRSSTLNQFGRQRGELHFSNKDIMLSKILDSYLTRTGMPHKFDNGVPLMLEFKSALPSLQREVDVSNSSSNRAVYKDDFAGLHWAQDSMDTTIDLGGVAQAMLKKILWAKYFLRRNHKDSDFPGEVFVGQNAEDGLRGAMLTLEAVSTMLMLKAALFAEEKQKSSLLSFSRRKLRLTGINPFEYDPKNAIKYIPHEISPQLVYMGDMPVRHYDFAIKDGSSQLWDQASWLWATTEFFDFANPRKHDNWDSVFGYQTPYDGSLMEKKYLLLAEGIANVIFDNLQTMHTRDGILSSQWTLDGGISDRLAMQDMAIAMVALSNYIKVMDRENSRILAAKKLLKKQAEFLLQQQAKNGGFAENYSISRSQLPSEQTVTSIAFAVRALLSAADTLHEEKYAQAARKASQLMNLKYWDNESWIYRNKLGVNRVIYTPVDIAAILAAIREMSLHDRDNDLLDRYQKFFVQAVDVSGLQQAETTYTGEDINKIRQGETDSDGDGIPFLGTDVDGVRVAAVFASKVSFDLGKNPGENHPVPLVEIADNGKALFDANCTVCHGVNGTGNEGPPLVNNPYVQLSGREAVMSTIEYGRTAVGMPAWKGSLSNAQIQMLTDHIQGLK